MDVLAMEQRFGELGEADFNAILDNDVFSTPSMEHYSMDNDTWFDSLFEDPVLNDKMITEAANPPHIKSEHSYSLANEGSNPGSPLTTKAEDLDMDMLLTTTCRNLENNTQAMIPQTIQIKTEPEQTPLDMTTIKQPTIVLTTTRTISTLNRERTVLPKVDIKLEPQDYDDTMSDNMDTDTIAFDNISLPPTPPSSSGSDSEGGQSPTRSPPASPVRIPPVSRQVTKSVTAASNLSNPAAIYSTPIPQSGVLILTEEEKRTLISEGYPIPSKLPLTKVEEKNLKKVRRKIKNKISAQESRRKRKEYLECLEKRVEQYSQENGDLRKKVDNLESNNKSLLSQLQKLQSMVSRCARPSATSTQASTCLMVLVLCFAVFVGSWSPTSFNIGYSSVRSTPHVAKTMGPQTPMGPHVADPKVDAYSTPNMRSRVLLALRDEYEDSTCYEPYGPPIPHMDMIERKPTKTKEEPAAIKEEPTVVKEEPTVVNEPPVVVVKADPATLDVIAKETNKTAELLHIDQASMHPDIAAEIPSNVNLTAKLIDATVDATS